MKPILACAFAIAVMMGSSAAYAVQPDEIMSDPAMETRARDLSRELRCMVCQNQSIDDSEAAGARFAAPGARADRGRRQRCAGDRFPGGALWRVRAAETAAQAAHLVAVAVATAGAGRRRICTVDTWPALQIRSSRRPIAARIDRGRKSAAGTADHGGTAGRQAGLGPAINCRIAIRLHYQSLIPKPARGKAEDPILGPVRCLRLRTVDFTLTRFGDL